ncbi:MAG: phage tail tape measure protein [Candidatus Hatepunaea meridiana]|nr:phage tail tape measure protein [Candidatus Hatepunaea meridiana]
MSMLQGFTQGINIRIIGSSNLAGTMGDAVSQMDKFKASARNLMKIGGWMLGVGTAMTGFAALTVKSTNATTKALGEMASLGFKDLKSLEKAAHDFSNQFAGITKSDFISAAYDIKSGIASLSDTAVGEFTKIAALTAKATKASVSEMTSLFATGYGIFKDFYGGLSDFEFGELFSGGISAAVRAFKTTGPEMAGAISNIGAMATSALIPLEEQLSVLGMLQATMSGAEAGTRYRAFMKSAAEAGEQLGISFVDANNNLLPIPNILERIRGKYGETVDAVEKMELMKAFGRIEALTVVDLLMPKIDALKGNIDDLGVAMRGGTSTTLEMATAMNVELGAVLGILSQRIHNTFEVLGKAILPVVIPIGNAVSKVALAFQKWAASHPLLLKLGMGIALIGGALLAMVGGLALAGGMLQLSMVGIIGLAASLGIGTASSLTFTTALGGLAGALWATMAPILPIIAAAGLLYLAWKTNFLGIQDTAKAVWSALAPVFASLKNIILTVKNVIVSAFGSWIKSLSEWYTAWNEKFTGARSPLLGFAGLVAYTIGFTIGIFSRLFGWLKEHKVLGAGLAVVFGGGALGMFKYTKATGGLANAMRTLPYYLRVAGAELKYLSMKMAAFDPATLPAKIKGAFSATATVVKTSVTSMISAFTRGMKAAWSFAIGMVRSTISWTVKFAQGIGMIIRQLGILAFNFLKVSGKVALFGAKMIWTGVTATGQLLKGLALTSAALMRQAAQWVLAKVAMAASTVATGIATAAQWALNVAMTANPIGLVVTGIIAGVALIGSAIYLIWKHWDTIWGAIKSSTITIWKALTSFGRMLSSFFVSIWEGLKTPLLSIANWIVNKINWLLEKFNTVYGIIGIKIPLIPELVVSANDIADQIAPAKVGVEVFDYTKSDSLEHRSPWTIKTRDTSVGVNVQPSNDVRNFVSSAITYDHSDQATRIDRSVNVHSITINSSDQEGKSIRDQLMDFFAELASQSEGIEGVIINA